MRMMEPMPGACEESAADAGPRFTRRCRYDAIWLDIRGPSEVGVVDSLDMLGGCRGVGDVGRWVVGGDVADEVIGPEVGTDPVGGAILFDNPRGAWRRGRDAVRGCEGRGAVAEDHPGLVSRSEPQRDGLGEKPAQTDDLLAGVLHAGQDDDAEGAALGQHLGEQSGGLLADLRVGVRGEDGELVDGEHVERVRRSRLM